MPRRGVARIEIPVKLSVRFAATARARAAACGLDLGRWIEQAGEAFLADERCAHRGRGDAPESDEEDE